MNYNVDALKSMLELYNKNIESFTLMYHRALANEATGLEDLEQKINEMVKERRDLAATIENDGMGMEGVRIDTMMYEAHNGADTSWWAGN